MLCNRAHAAEQAVVELPALVVSLAWGHWAPVRTTCLMEVGKVTDEHKAEMLKMWNLCMEADQEAARGEFTSTKLWLASLSDEERDFMQEIMLHFTYMALQRGKAIGRAIAERNALGRGSGPGGLTNIAGIQGGISPQEEGQETEKSVPEVDEERDAVSRRLLRDVFGGG